MRHHLYSVYKIFFLLKLSALFIIRNVYIQFDDTDAKNKTKCNEILSTNHAMLFNKFWIDFIDSNWLVSIDDDDECNK